MPVPRPTQLSGARFLADNKRALLADDPRVGKTGAAIIAADYTLAGSVLVVTTASGRAVWRRAFPEWSVFRRPVQVLTPKDTLQPDTRVAIVGWPSIADPKLRAQLLARFWDVLILDESHYAKNPETKRAQAVYGEQGIAAKAERIWCLTGTPMPNAPNDLWPMLHALAPERIASMSYDQFLWNYCVVRMKKISNFRKIPVVMGGKNLDDLRQRLAGFMLRRTQADVGIREPVYETFPLTPSPADLREIAKNVDTEAVMAAARTGETKALNMHLGPLRRLTGQIKAPMVIEALEEEFECGLDKIVLMHWHTETGRILRDGLAKYGVAQIDGSTPARDREIAEQRFHDDPNCRVFVGQIAAAGEAIDLSAASEMMFVETSFIPKDMRQAALRVTNYAQQRLVRVRVAVLEGSIDAAAETILLRKWSSIREVLKAA